MFTPDVEIALVAIVLIAYLGVREWLRHVRRRFIHEERLAAIQKGIDLPALEQESNRSAWNVQRTLLLAGLIWMSIGLCAYVTLSALIASPANVALEVPVGLQWLGIAPAAIGLSHLIVYWAGKRKEQGTNDKEK
jgi:hypothetical protein